MGNRRQKHGVISPDEHVSLAFLRQLLIDNCIGAGGQEYCEEEVRDLIYLKESRMADKQEKYFLSKMNEWEEEQCSMEESMPDNVVSIQRKPKPRWRYVCSEEGCKFKTNSEDDLVVAWDEIDPKTKKFSSSLSGRYSCPNCGTVFSESICDEQVSMSERGDIIATIPAEILDDQHGAEVFPMSKERSEDGKMFAFNLLVAMLQPVRKQIRARYPRFYDSIFFDEEEE